MTNVHDLPCQPDMRVMHEFIGRLFANSGQRGMIEIAWTAPHHPHKLTHAVQFDIANLDDALDCAERVNAMANCNVYFGPGLRRPGTRDRAADADVEALIAYWADFDAPGSLSSAITKCKQLRIEPNLITYTGRAPHLRGQMWWMLEEPTTDLRQHRMVQSALAAALGGDHSVSNPSRVMRLIGSVAWPLKNGRVLEMTGLSEAPRIHPYTPEEMVEKLEAAKLLKDQAAGVVGLDLIYKKTTPELIDKIRTNNGWHEGQRDLIARWTERYKISPDDWTSIAGLFQLPGYSLEQTVREIHDSARGAYKKFAPIGAGAAQRDPGKIEIIGLDALESRDPPAWQIAGAIPEKSFGYVYGASNTFKTFLAIDMALSIAYGRPWQGRPVKQGVVAYILGEGQGAFANRVRCWRQARGLLGQSAPFHTVFRPIKFMDPKDLNELIEALGAAEVKPDWIFVDTVQRNFGVGDPDKTQDMTQFVNMIDAVRGHFDCGVFAVHHAGKDATKGARNSSVLYASADFEIRVEREENSPKLKVTNTKPKDWEPFPPMWLTTRKIEAVDPRTGEEVSSLVIDETAELAVRGEVVGKIEAAITRLLSDRGHLGFGDIQKSISGDSGNLARTLRKLQDKGIIKKSEDSPTVYYLAEQYQ